MSGEKLDIDTEKSDVERFRRIIETMYDTYLKKNHDYGNAFSDMYDELGVNYGYGKIREKVNRIKTLKDADAMVESEPLDDALLDCANYCILTLMEHQKRKEKGGRVEPLDNRGSCDKHCIYNDNGRCNMFDDISMPDNVSECRNYTEAF